MHALRWTERKLGIAAADVELLSPLPLNECVSRLQAAISPFTASFVAGPVIGDITGTRLRAQKQIFGWRFQAHLEADLIDGGDHTLIKGRFTKQVRGGLLGLVLVNILLTWSSLPADAGGLMLSLFLLFWLSLSRLMLYLANQDRRFLLHFLHIVVGARPTQDYPPLNGSHAFGARSDAATPP